MTWLSWSPFPADDTRLAVFSAVFLIALGAALGLVVGADGGGTAAAAEAHYGRSVVNTTYSAVAVQAQAGVIPPWLAFALFIGVLIATNLATTALAAYVPRYLEMPLAVGVVAYLLAYTGFVPALIGVRFAAQYGVAAALAAMAPNGVIEVAAMALAGALGLLAATAPDAPAVRARVRSVYWRRVAPLIAVAAVVECTITPLLLYLAMR
jgi:hypothetical protein